MSILSGPAIRAAVDRGDIVIDPYRPEHVNPASIDLTLGGTMLEYPAGTVFDCKQPPTEHVVRDEVPVGDSFRLYPGTLYLMHTAEIVFTERYVPVLDGKSSLGRLGVKVHEPAGY